MADDLFAWKDDSGIYHAVPVDIVTSHEDERSAEVTSFPVEKGSNINDHIIHQPDTLTLEVCQTQSPFPSPARPGSAFTAPKGFSTKAIKLDVRNSVYRPPSSEKLKVQPSAFQPGGLLAITSAVGAAVSAVTNAIGLTSADGDISTAPTMAVQKPEDVSATVFVSDSPVDRIGELHDKLIEIKQNGRFCKIVFRGKIYPDYILTRVRWVTQKGEVGLGRFSLTLQTIRTVETATAELPDPTSLRLKLAKAQAKPPKPVDSTPDAKGGPRESLLSKGLGGAGA